MNILSKVIKVLPWLQKITGIKDSIVVGIVGGLVGTLIMDLSNLMLWRRKKTEMLYGHIAGSLLMSSLRTNQRKNFILGQISHMMVGSLLGIPMTYVFKKTGRDHHLLKGIGMSWLTWSVFYDLGQRLGIFRAKPHLTKTHYAALWDNLVYGIATAQAIVAVSDPSLFPASSVSQAGASQPGSQASRHTGRSRRSQAPYIQTDPGFENEREDQSEPAPMIH